MELIFLSPKEARSIVRNLPISEGNKTPVDCPEKYRQILKQLVSRLPRGRPLGFDIFALSQVKILTVQSGHPFTLGTHMIIFPLNYYTRRPKEQLTIFVHELVHLHQRANPHAFEKYYTLLNFVKARLCFTPALKNLLMYNPDGEKYEWIWVHQGQGYVPIGINHKTYIGLTGPIQDKKSLTPSDIRPVIEVPEYYHNFQTQKQLYHPNEIVAHQITDALFKKK